MFFLGIETMAYFAWKFYMKQMVAHILGQIPLDISIQNKLSIHSEQLKSS